MKIYAREAADPGKVDGRESAAKPTGKVILVYGNKRASLKGLQRVNKNSLYLFNVSLSFRTPAANILDIFGQQEHF